MKNDKVKVIVGEKVEYMRHGLNAKGKRHLEIKRDQITTADYEKKSRVDSSNSYATESMLRTKCDSAIRKDPGNKASILRHFANKGK